VAPATSASSPSSATEPAGSGASPPASSPRRRRSSTSTTPASTSTPSPAPWSSYSSTGKTNDSPPAWKTPATATSTPSRQPSASTPRRGHQERRGRKRTRLLPQQCPPHALPLVPLPRPVRRLRRRRIKLQDRHRPAPQAVRHALDPRGSRLDHRPPLQRGQQHLGSHLQHPGHSDTHSLTRRPAKLPASHHKIDAHPTCCKLRGIVVGNR
jgi:hypothetical protein